MLGSPIDPDPSTLILEELHVRHPDAFKGDAKLLLDSVVAAGLPFVLSDFQVDPVSPCTYFKVA